MIKIIRSASELSEERLNGLETKGLILISVNHVKGSKLVDDGYGWMEAVKTTTWVYHFRRSPHFVAPGEFNG